MSEFKFACPICGQHLTADVLNSGGQIDCPTCFRKLIVPQAPASSDSKLILSAKLAGEHRTSRDEVVSSLRSKRRHPLTRWSALAVLALVLAAAGLWARIYLERQAGSREAKPALESPAPPVERKVHSFWTADLTKVVLPETPVGGKVIGEVVEGAGADLDGGTLTLRATNGPQGELSIYLFAQQPRDLSGKAFAIPRERPAPRPRVELTWQAGTNRHRVTFEENYVLKMSFGQPINGRVPGEIYLSLPDDYKSFVAGRFVAEITGSGKK